MKWLLLTCFLLWARHGEGGALKCVPNSENGSCPDLQEADPTISYTPLEVECLAGSEWESNCHLCRCSDAGAAECVKQALCDLPNTVEPIHCKPNTTFERGCNTCVCLESGLGLCTLKNCHTILAPVPSKANLPSGIDCAPGSTWKNKCNDCVCSPDGLRFCTDKACPGDDSGPLLGCEPHSLWKKECNTCWCTSDGRAMCTKMGCVGIPSDMNFSNETESTESSDAGEEEQLIKTPDSMPNAIHDSDDNTPKGSIRDIKSNHSESIEENLTDVFLKDLDDMDNNFLVMPLNEHKLLQGNAQQNDKSEHFNEFTTNSKEMESSYTKNLNDFKYRASEETFPQKDGTKKRLVLDLNEMETPYKNQELQKEHVKTEPNFVKTDSKRPYQHLEEMSAPYIDHSHIMHHILKRSVCKPNQDFQNECNTCKCSATGQSYSCTQNECMEKGKEDVDKEVEVFMESEGVDHIERHSVCKPHATFYIGCNPCNCNADGTDFSCTNKPCQLPEDVEVFHELNAVKSAVTPKPKKKVCVENRMFIMNCNTCWCNEDGTSYFCTRKVCVPELPEEPTVEDGKPEKLRIIKRECRPDEVFELDCNMCRCNADGKSFSCTRRACIDEDTKNETRSRNVRAAPQEPPKSCQPGQEFRMDCNKCLCDNEGQDFSCTRIDCTAINNNNGGTRRKRDVSQKVSSDCVPGSVFEQGCNVCRCTQDGGHATCTLKRCAKAKENSSATPTESSFRCNPGEQFKQSCNDCSCSADGKSVFCTLLVCDEDLTP